MDSVLLVVLVLLLILVRMLILLRLLALLIVLEGKRTEDTLFSRMGVIFES